MRHAVIMAGGTGTRLWPASRRGRPKQVLHLFGGDSLLRKSFLRLSNLIPPERISIITMASHLPFAAKEVPEIPPENLFGEPVGRDTANAVAMASAIVHHRDPDATIGIFTADHMIHPVERFEQAIEAGFLAAEQHPESLVTFGVTPTEAHTGYGYIQKGECLQDGLYRVSRFVEKPDKPTADQYLKDGNYCWNSGMFVWKSKTILAEIERHLPETFLGVDKIAEQWGSPSHEETITSLYPSFPRISIDYAVMQKAQHVLMQELTCEWADVGNWKALRKILQPDDSGSVSTSNRVCHQDSSNLIVVAGEEHLVATVGVENLVIVHTPDTTLVCSADKTEEVKQLLEKIQQQYGDRYA